MGITCSRSRVQQGCLRKFQVKERNKERMGNEESKIPHQNLTGTQANKGRRSDKEDLESTSRKPSGPETINKSQQGRIRVCSLFLFLKLFHLCLTGRSIHVPRFGFGKSRHALAMSRILDIAMWVVLKVKMEFLYLLRRPRNYFDNLVGPPIS